MKQANGLPPSALNIRHVKKILTNSNLILSFSPPNDKKSFCSIEGEWNGVMYAKWASGVSSYPTLHMDRKKNCIQNEFKEAVFREVNIFVFLTGKHSIH